MTSEFVQWLEREIWRRRLTQAELARRGNLSPARISQVLAAGESPGWQFVAGVARALDKDLSVVAHKAGLWDQPPDGHSIEQGEYVELFKQLTAEQQRLLLLAMQGWAAHTARVQTSPGAQVQDAAESP